MKPIETGHIILIAVGALLVFSGPLIVYRTTKTIMNLMSLRRTEPKTNLHIVNNGINYLIAFLFFCAGILFIINNLRGNPLG